MLVFVIISLPLFVQCTFTFFGYLSISK